MVLYYDLRTLTFINYDMIANFMKINNKQYLHISI